MDPKLLINGIKIAAFASLITPFIKAMDFYFPFVGPKSLYFMAVAEIMFFLWIVLAWRWKQYRPNFKNPVVIAILMFLAVSFASGLFGADFSASFWSKFERMDGILMLCHLGAFALVLASVFKRRDWMRFFCASVGAAAVIGIQALFDLSSVARGGGLIGNDSFWATYILFNIFVALYLFLSQKLGEHKKTKIFGGVAFFILSICLLFEGSQIWESVAIGEWPLMQKELFINIINSGARAAKISFLAGMVLLGILWLAVRKNAVAKFSGIVILCASVCAGIALIFLSTIPGNVIYEKMSDRFSEATINGRIVVWEIAWKGFLERPLLGWGPENFNLVFSRYYNPCMGTPECSGELWFDRAHNIIFDTLVATGVLGMLAYAALFGTALYAFWRAFFSGKYGFAAAGVFTALFAAYLLQNLTVFDMIVSYLLLFVCLGFAAYVYDEQNDTAQDWPLPLEPRHVLLPAIAGVISLSVFVLAPLSVDRDVVAAASAPYGSQERMDLYRQALETSPMGKHQITMFFVNQWIAAAQNPEMLKYVTQKQAEDNYSFFSGELEECVRESPLDFQLQLELGQLYNSWSGFDKSKLSQAENYLEKARLISPQNQQAYWDLAQNLIYQKKFDRALELAREAYNLYPNNAQAKRIAGDVATFVEQSKTETGQKKSSN